MMCAEPLGDCSSAMLNLCENCMMLLLGGVSIPALVTSLLAGVIGADLPHYSMCPQAIANLCSQC